MQLWLSRAGGLIIIFFGLYLVGLIRIGWLEQEHKFSVTGIKSKYLTSFVFGVAFAAGWTPCVGAALGAILGLAATEPTLAFTLLLAYSAGLGVPFIITGLFASQAVGWISKYSRVLHYINIVFGILLIVIGILIFTQTLSLIANLPELNGFLLGSLKNHGKKNTGTYRGTHPHRRGNRSPVIAQPEQVLYRHSGSTGKPDRNQRGKGEVVPLRKGDCRAVGVCER